jgi:hypothetical protein
MHDLTPSFRTAFVRLASEHRCSPAQLDARGAWVLSIDGSMSSASAIVASLPGAWELDLYEEEELVDATGEGIDLEWTSEVWVSPDQRAILACIDHWQAGLIGTITVLPDQASFVQMRTLLAERDSHAELAS